MEQGKFPQGSIRAAVADRGNLWLANSAHVGEMKAACADAAAMVTATYLRAAGAKPHQRAEWREYTDKCRHGEIHQ